MRIFQITSLSLFFLYNCGGRINYNNIPEYDHLLLVEYKNEYKNGKIIQSVFTESELYSYSKTPIYIRFYECDYIYNTDRLICKKKYEIKSNENRSLYRVTNYSGNKEENIRFRDGDTISYQLREFDPNGRLVHHIMSEILSVPVFDLNINDNFDETITYDSEGNVLERSIIDLTTGITRYIRSFHDTSPSLPPAPNLDIVVFSTETSGDTIVTKKYLNGELDNIRKEIKNKNHEWEFTYDAHSELMRSCETIYIGNERVKITVDPGFQMVDSVFYMNDREIKSVMLSPEGKTTVFTDYDSFGNVLIQKRYTKFIKTKM